MNRINKALWTAIAVCGVVSLASFSAAAVLIGAPGGASEKLVALGTVWLCAVYAIATALSIRPFSPRKEGSK